MQSCTATDMQSCAATDMQSCGATDIFELKNELVFKDFYVFFQTVLVKNTGCVSFDFLSENVNWLCL